MNFNKYLFIVATAAIPFSACSDDEDLGQEYKPTTLSVSGKVEKGPFVSGSSITIQPMDSKLQTLGNMYSSSIEDNIGTFTFGSKLFEAPFAEMAANGYFFNEVEGSLSKGTLNLRALVDLSDKTTVNVNILTHLKYHRIQHLIGKGYNFKDANKQAQNELFTAFGLQAYAAKDASSFSITEGTNESAALIAISSLMLIDKSEAAVTEYLAKLSKEFGETGTFGNQTKAQIKRDKANLYNQLTRVKDNILNRYEELGIKINVKDLQYYLDWDEDGIAGNEILKEGQEVKLGTNYLEAPKEGGDYTIKISSPIPVYLEPQIGDQTETLYPEEDYYHGLYENSDSEKMKFETEISKNNLNVKVSPLNSRMDKTSTILLFDCVGNIVSEIKISQKGDENASLPKLGQQSLDMIKSFTECIAQGMSELNTIEQLYHYNKGNDIVSKEINANSTKVENIWTNFYKANRELQTLKEYDSRELGVYQDHLNVFSALYYYYMTMLWGDVPYLNSYDAYNGWNTSFPRNPKKEIVEDLKKNLIKAINSLEEKRNITLTKDKNDLFFISKDVARILLANIYMSQGEYNQAEPLLNKVITNGYYELDNSNYNDKETINKLYNERQGKETILATYYERGSRGNITIAAPTIIPIMTYTDVILSYAECLYKNGKVSDAETQLKKVMDAKDIIITGENIGDKIKKARLELTLYTNTNFSFMKRNNLATSVYGIESYRLLLPIPISEIIKNSSITQNPGY